MLHPICRCLIQFVMREFRPTNDPRFYPLTEEEVFQADIEISILSPLTDISDYNQIQIGTHGLVIWDMGSAVEANITKPFFYRKLLLRIISMSLNF